MNVSKNSFANKLFEAFASTSRSRYIFLCNLDNNCARLSQNGVDFFELENEYIYDFVETWAKHIHIDDEKEFREEMRKILSGEKTDSCLEYRAKGKDGNYVVCRSRGMVIKDDERGTRYFAGTIANHGIIDNVDPTTNLYNMYEFIREIDILEKKKQSVIVLFVGFKRFSDINDVYGYAFGNMVMNKFAKILMEEIHGDGNVFRMDGSKFALTITNRTIGEVKNLYLYLQAYVQHEMELEGKNLHLSLCGSMISLNKYRVDAHTLYSSGRYALAKSKNQKMGELVVVNDDLMLNNIKTIELIATMRKNIQEGCKGFYMCYQPIISSETGKLVALEALLRWNMEPYGEISPGIFIPWIEHDGSFFELGNWILKTSLIDTKELLKNHPEFLLHVNVSYTQIQRSEFRSKLLEILEETGFPEQNLCLELTERCRYLDMNLLKEEVAFYKKHGIKIAIDDFGTGFSSLNLLKEFPIDCIKIDRGFIKEIENSVTDQSIVGAVIKCAKNLDIGVCVEGIEDENIFNYMENFEVSSYQGYYYSRPIEIKQLKNLLSSKFE